MQTSLWYNVIVLHRELPGVNGAVTLYRWFSGFNPLNPPHGLRCHIGWAHATCLSPFIIFNYYYCI